MNNNLPQPVFFTRFTPMKAWYGELPHWEADGVAVFVTFRLGDALPQDLIGPWKKEVLALRETLNQIEQSRGPDHSVTGQSEQETRIRNRLYDLQVQIEKWLDAGTGSCIFSNKQNRNVMEDAIRFYDGNRYALYGFVVMPNHVHMLFSPFNGQSVRNIIRLLKHFVSTKLISLKSWEGEFWQKEYWDTLIRDGEHFKRVRSYIRGNNPDIAYDAYDVPGPSRSDWAPSQ